MIFTLKKNRYDCDHCIVKMVQVWLFVGLQKVLQMSSISSELFFKLQL